MEERSMNPADPHASGAALTLRPDLPLGPHVPTPPGGHFEDDDTIDLRQYWDVIVKRKWTVLAFFAIVVIAVGVGTLLMTPIYRASLTVQIERNEAKVMDIQQVSPAEGSSESREFYQTQYELLKSRTLAQRVIAQLRLEEHPAFAKQADSGLLAWIGLSTADDDRDARRRKAGYESPVVARFLKVLTIEPVRYSRLVKVHFEDADAELATRAVNAVAEAFIALNLERRMDASSYAGTFLRERLEQMKARLEDSERSLNQFARAKEIIKVDEKQASVDSIRLQEYTMALAKVQQERIQAESLFARIRVGKEQGLPEVLQSVTIQRLKEMKSKLESEYQEGLKLFKPGYPRMLQIEAQIAEVQARISDESENVRLAITSGYEAAKHKEALIAAQLQQAKSSMLGLQDRSVEYNVLKREADTNRTLYEGLLQRYKEIGVAGGVGLNNIAVVDRAEVPRDPFKPKLPLNLLLAGFLGIFGGVAFAFLFEHLDDTIKHGEDVERQLGLALLGVIPFLKSTTAGNGALAFELVEEPRSSFAEAFRSLRTSLQFSTETGVPRVLMVTSSSVAEGKSTTALTLAVAFAQTGKNVLLIDADLRKASQHKALGLANDAGLTNLLAGEAQAVDVTVATSVPGLYVMTSGPLPPNPAELLASAKMASLLTLAAEKFDLVIIDGPPVLGLADAPLLGNLAEATLLVVEYAATRRGFANDAIKRLRSARTRLLGAVLTKAEAHVRGYGYHQNYYDYEGASDGGRQRLSA